ncbi:PTS sugar transporter subunit IIA [Limisphaera sp. VF-2]|jgi:PTS system nitrogen regulatory IIA component|uniref:PTS sugar transporter subunit IIA n=1 Tax=Limisphaera sp. VF-2 TaxID=3400418 RepID=UPI0030AD1DEA
MQGLSGAGLQLHALLSVERICLQLRAQTRDDVLRELVGLIPSLAGAPERQERLFQALREREELHSTGIGDGVALPHARQALPDLLTEPELAFGRHPAGVAFRAVDGRPVRLFFLLLAPNLTIHLAMLARISRLLRQAALREALLAAPSPQAVMDLVREAELQLNRPGV